MISRRIDKTPAWVLSVIVIGAVALLTFVAFGGRFPWQHDYELKAMVSSGLDLSSRSPVRIAGVEVGRVKKVERGPGNTAIVTMAIKKQGLPIHADATIKVRPRIFLEGNFFVDLKPGTPQGKILKDGSTLPITQTSVAVQFDEILSSLQSGTRENLRSLLRGYADIMKAGGAEALNAQFPDWGPAFTNISLASEAARGETPHDLSRFIDRSEKTVKALSSRDRQLAALITGLDRTVTALASNRVQLEQSLPALDRLVHEAPGALSAVDAALPETRALAIEVRPALRLAPATLRLAEPVLQQARALVAPRELPALLDQLNPAIRDLAPLEPRLTALFDRLEPVTECVRRNALPVLKTPVQDGDLSNGDPPYRELVHTGVGLSSASQNFDGNGAAVRYHAGFGDQLVTLGSIPSVGESIVGLTSQPILGSRPKKPEKAPPFRPDVACVSNDRPDLKAETGAAPQQKQVSLRELKK
jgi:virulence factor Mce-like protein